MRVDVGGRLNTLHACDFGALFKPMLIWDSDSDIGCPMSARGLKLVRREHAIARGNDGSPACQSIPSGLYSSAWPCCSGAVAPGAHWVLGTPPSSKRSPSGLRRVSSSAPMLLCCASRDAPARATCASSAATRLVCQWAVRDRCQCAVGVTAAGALLQERRERGGGRVH